mgnify:FL=1
MSLSVDDFFEAFKDCELREVKLSTWKGDGQGVINLRGLTYADVKKFTSLSRKITDKKAIDMLSGSGDIEDYDDALDRAEDHLLKIALCNAEGKFLFTDDKTFKKWKTKVPADVVNEIICHIECMNELYGGFEKMEDVIEAYKKK